MSLTRRSLLRRGGASAAGAGVLGSLAAAGSASAQLGDDRGHGALVVVLPLVRADHVKAFEGGSPAKTPNLNELTKRSLRFDRAIPETMPAVSARRALVTGMRAFPFRDWRRLEGFPSVPGFNPVWDYQPLVMERTRDAGIETIYVTDNPLFAGPRFADVRRPPAGGAGASPGDTLPTGIDQELLKSFARLTDATRRTFGEGRRALAQVKRAGSFFVGVDPFDPVDAYAAPPFYVRPGRVEDDGVGPTDGRLVELQFSDKDVDRVREAYVAHVEAVDDELGKLMDAVPDDTAVFVLGDHGLALGEHGYLGRAAPTSHRLSYEIPFLIRHPNGQKAGDDVDWYASTHDVAPTLLSFLGVTIPGKMDGEDLTALFDDVDQDDLPKREKSITAVGSQIIIRDRRWLVVADRERIIRRMFDDDEDVEDNIKRYDNIANEDTGKLTELSVASLVLAGGTLPEFGPDGALRPPREHGNDDTDDDGIPNEFDPFDNDHPEDGVTKKDLLFDGRMPEGGELPSVAKP
ncbi:MAG TPA: sulfatase-like hydrolase/transferase [Thermoleophilaceae bacterium]|jgi:arylsulfatase A-like enzyme|nr:sulfatase-like hydrolase/transferase [Thermoleophilaceae bacterium]